MDCKPLGSSVHWDSHRRLPCPSPGDLPTQRLNPMHLLHLLHWQTGYLPLASPGKPFPNICCVWKSLSHVWLFATPWTIQSMEFSRPEYWSGQLFPSPGDLPNPGVKPRSPTLQADSLPAEPQGKPFLNTWGQPDSIALKHEACHHRITLAYWEIFQNC